MCRSARKCMNSSSNRPANSLKAFLRRPSGRSIRPGLNLVNGLSEFVEIIRYARENNIDLLVLGTHGRGAIAHMLMGSVAEKIVRKAPCPVLTVRHPEHEFVMP